MDRISIIVLPAVLAPVLWLGAIGTAEGSHRHETYRQCLAEAATGHARDQCRWRFESVSPGR